MAELTLNPAALRSLLADPAGPVMADMARRGTNVLEAARTLLARSEYSGDLAESLRIAVTPVGVEVGSDLPQCVYLHNGTGPQHITSNGAFGSVPDPRPNYRPPWRAPRFAAWSRDHGMNPYQFAQHVFAVGTAPNPFLRDALSAAAT